MAIDRDLGRRRDTPMPSPGRRGQTMMRSPGTIDDRARDIAPDGVPFNFYDSGRMDPPRKRFPDNMPPRFPMPSPMPTPTPTPPRFPGPMPMPMPMPGPREGLPPRPMPFPSVPPGMGPFAPEPFPDQMPKGGQGIMEAAAVDPSDFRTIQKLLDAGLDPNDYIQAASMAYDDDDYGPFIPPSVIEMDRFGTGYGPQDEYLFDRERGFENRIFGKDPDYREMSGIMSVLPQETQMAELTQGQKDFIRSQGGDQFQSRESLMNKIMTPQGGFDRGPFLGIFGGGQEPTTRQELDAFLNSGMVG